VRQSIFQSFAIPALSGLVFVSAPAIAQADQGVSIKSEVLAVKETVDAKGVKKNIFVPATTVVPGTPLVIVLRYQNGGRRPASKFVIDNPVPSSVRFTGLGIKSEFGTVSVDGGKSYGALATLKTANPDKSMRAARPSDVTHVRWIIATPIAPAQSGMVMFYGVVE
jgi:hypothetical protein